MRTYTCFALCICLFGYVLWVLTLSLYIYLYKWLSLMTKLFYWLPCWLFWPHTYVKSGPKHALLQGYQFTSCKLYSSISIHLSVYLCSRKVWLCIVLVSVSKLSVLFNFVNFVHHKSQPLLLITQTHPYMCIQYVC